MAATAAAMMTMMMAVAVAVAAAAATTPEMDDNDDNDGDTGTTQQPPRQAHQKQLLPGNDAYHLLTTYTAHQQHLQPMMRTTVTTMQPP